MQPPKVSSLLEFCAFCFYHQVHMLLCFYSLAVRSLRKARSKKEPQKLSRNVNIHQKKTKYKLNQIGRSVHKCSSVRQFQIDQHQALSHIMAKFRFGRRKFGSFVSSSHLICAFCKVIFVVHLSKHFILHKYIIIKSKYFTEQMDRPIQCLKKFNFCLIRVFLGMQKVIIIGFRNFLAEG